MSVNKFETKLDLSNKGFNQKPGKDLRLSGNTIIENGASIKYASNLSGTYTLRSVVDKEYVDTEIAAIGMLSGITTNALNVGAGYGLYKVKSGNTLQFYGLLGSGSTTLSRVGNDVVVYSTSLTLGETSTTAYRGDRGKMAFNYSQIHHLPLSGGTMCNMNLVTQLNADLLDGFHGSSYIRQFTGLTTNFAPKWNGSKLINSLYSDYPDLSISIGQYNTVQDQFSLGIGGTNTVICSSVGIGQNNDLEGYSNIGIGNGNSTFSNFNILFGFDNVANNDKQIIIGSSNTASGCGDIVIGCYGSVASTLSPSMMVNLGKYTGDTLTQNNTLSLLGAGDGSTAFFVGIGTTTPAYPLSVVGVIQTNEKVVANTIYTGNGEMTIDTTNEGGIYSLSADQLIAVMNTVAGSDIYHYANDAIKYCDLKSGMFVTGGIASTSQISGSTFKSTVVTGTAPISLQSTTLNTNLNADLLDGCHASSFLLKSDNLGWSNLSNGSTVAGCGTLASGSSICQNTVFGVNALNSLTSGIGNVGVGYGALSANTTGSYNVGIGDCALSSNSKGTNNYAFGFSALGKNICGCNNYAFGYLALKSTTGNTCNIAIGNQAQASSTSGNKNISIGNSTLYLNVSGSDNLAFGQNALTCNISGNGNIGIGINSLFCNCTGSNNIALGCFSLYSSVTGSDNVSLGLRSLYNNISGCNNVAIGQCSLNTNTSGCYNIALGQLALKSNIVGKCNIALGVSSMSSSTGGTGNVALGHQTLMNNISGNDNFALGTCALWCNVSGCNNVAIGITGLHDNLSGNNNTSIGYLALFRNTTGSNNVGIGCNALFCNTIGSYNIGEGQFVLARNINGDNNIALGQCTMYSNTGGTGNIAMGTFALSGNILGCYNVGIGHSAMRINNTGCHNLSLGYQSLYSNTVGHYNVAFGTNSLFCNISGCYNIGIGYLAMGNATGGTQNIAIGLSALCKNTTGLENIVIGTSGLGVNTVGNYNTSIGSNTLISNISGNLNIGFGRNVLNGNISGCDNIGIGQYSLGCNISGSGNITLGTCVLPKTKTSLDNIGIGNSAGRTLTGGSCNIFYGYLAGCNVNQALCVNNSISIGANTYSTKDNQIMLGATGVTETILREVVLSKTKGSGIRIDAITPTWGWRDLEGVELVDAIGVNAATLTVYRTPVREFAYSVNDIMDIRFHIPHDYVPNTNIFIHMHWSHNGTAITGNIVGTFNHTYAKGHNQAIFPTSKAVVATYSTINIATTPRYQHRIEEVQLSVAGGSVTQMDTALLEPDGLILVNFVMTTIPTITDGSEEPFIHRIDIHYQSTNMPTKQKAPNFYV